MRSPAILITRNEFGRMMRSPFVALVFIVLSLLMVINAMGNSALLSDLGGDAGGTDPFYDGLSNTYYTTSLLFTFIAMCIGVVSISEERSKGSL